MPKIERVCALLTHTHIHTHTHTFSGEPEMIESHEWEQGNGQKLRLRQGFYGWGKWSARLERFKYPGNIVVNGPLDMAGVEEGVCLDGSWAFTNGTGCIANMTLMCKHTRPGQGGGLTLHFESGNWTFQRCRLAVVPGALTAVMAVAGDARVRLHECLVTRTEGVEIGSQGYGMFIWNKGSVTLDSSCVWELKVVCIYTYVYAFILELEVVGM